MVPMMVSDRRRQLSSSATAAAAMHARSRASHELNHTFNTRPLRSVKEAT